MASPPDGGAPPTFVRNGYPPDLPRRLRQGRWRIADEIDLHGLDRSAAITLTKQFLEGARGRCVLIVHGKGEVLREVLRAWLRQREEVLAFTEAPAARGGSGAMLVLLKD